MKRREFIIFSLLYFFEKTIPFSMANQNKLDHGRTCVVLDDAGGSKTSIVSLEKLALNETPANIAILPKSSFEKQALDILIDYDNADILLHQPMEPIDSKKNKPEEHMRIKGIKYNPKIHSSIYHFDSKALTYKIVKENTEHLNNYLYKKEGKEIVGLNNHMGSLITQDKNLMEGVCQYAFDKNLIIIDSRTTNKSVLYETATRMNVNAYLNKGFIDRKTEKNLGRLLNVRSDKVFIGHLQNKETINKYIKIAKNHKFSRISELSSS